MTDDINQIPSSSPNLRTELAQRLAALVPEAIADGKVDVVKLKELLEDDVRDDTERFGLFWPGKKRALRAAQEPTTATLRPMKDQSKDWDTTQNVFIEGDNLEVLKILQKRYHNSVKMIYIDPPYNTGKDFIYPDNYKEGLESYLEFTRQVDEDGKKLSSNAETEGRFHSNWLNMMYPRLKLARNLLTQDGVLLISIDDHELAQLRKLCDEVFGEQNFIASVVWQGGRKNDSRYVSVGHDYILIYARSEGHLAGVGTRWRERKAGVDAALAAAGELWEKSGHDATTATRDFRNWLASQQNLTPAVSRFKNIDAAGRVYNADKDLGWPGGGGPKYEVLHPLSGKPVSIPSTGWRFTQASLREQIDAGLVEFGLDETKIPRGKTFLAELDDQVVESVFTQIRTTAAQRLSRLMGAGVFDFPKDEYVLARWFRLVTGSDSTGIFMDFFAGSGSSAHAVMLLNAEDGGSRKCISVQLPEPVVKRSPAWDAGFRSISEISRTRISRAGDQVLQEYAETLAQRGAHLDIGFRSYQLTDTNFTKWNFASSIESEELGQRLLELRDSSADSASSDDLLCELLLKLGLSLSERIESRIVNGLDVICVGDGALLAYVNEHTKPRLDQLREILDLEPAKFIMLEDAFQGDDELKTNLKQICKTKQIELWTA